MAEVKKENATSPTKLEEKSPTRRIKEKKHKHREDVVPSVASPSSPTARCRCC